MSISAEEALWAIDLDTSGLDVLTFAVGNDPYLAITTQVPGFAGMF